MNFHIPQQQTQLLSDRISPRACIWADLTSAVRSFSDL